MRLFTVGDAQLALSSFDAWIERSATIGEIMSADIAVAGSFLRRLDLPLRTLDALHIAIAQRLDASLVGFDQRMITSARALGMAVATP
jgi:predicted nucleic acid-binding protein